jgi:hypothetical protein
MTKFLKGAIVRSRVSAQGLFEGSTYEVVGVSENRTPFGTFVTYALDRVAEHEPVHQVGNGHLILEEVV